MQDCGVLIPEKTLEEQDYEGKEDTRGVDAFISWAMGKGNSEIRRVALEGSDGAKEDYLTGLSYSVLPEALLTGFSPQEEAHYIRRGYEIRWDYSGQTCGTEDYQSRGQRDHKSEGMGREAQEPSESSFYNAIIAATIFSFELLRGRYRGRNGVLDVGARWFYAWRRRSGLVFTIQISKYPKRMFSRPHTELIPSFSTLFPAPPSTFAPCCLAALIPSLASFCSAFWRSRSLAMLPCSPHPAFFLLN